MAQVVEWPRFVGGPKHGGPVPEWGSQQIAYAPERDQYDIKFYTERKILIHDQLAVRVFVWEGDSYRKQLGAFMGDLAIHAFLALGIDIQEEPNGNTH